LHIRYYTPSTRQQSITARLFIIPRSRGIKRRMRGKMKRRNGLRRRRRRMRRVALLILVGSIEVRGFEV
jgi:hypothetical protein